MGISSGAALAAVNRSCARDARRQPGADLLLRHRRALPLHREPVPRLTRRGTSLDGPERILEGDYSDRRVIAGSTPVARRAGIQLARSPTSPRERAAPRSVAGSLGVTP